MVAVSGGEAPLAEVLLRAGAAVGEGDVDGETALHLATAAAFLCDSSEFMRVASCVRLLLEAGASPNQQNARGSTPLHYAARLRPEATVAVPLLQMLLRGATTTADAFVRNEEGLTPEGIAARDGHTQCAALLASYAAQRSATLQLHLLAEADDGATNSPEASPAKPKKTRARPRKR